MQFLKNLKIKQIVYMIMVLALTVAAFSGVRTFVRSLPTTIGGTNPIVEDGNIVSQTPGAQIPTQDISAAVSLPPAWDGASRVTILIMGLDYGDWSAERTDGPPRTDTMLLLTIDPLSKTAGMLSIPRDMWVDIPGFKYGKINTAYSLGEAYKLPGGGPALAATTVEHFLGVPIQYYAQIDFAAFVKFINEIGGVKITVSEEMVLDPIGSNNKVPVTPGRYTFDGDLALAYARNRKTEGGDIDRARRTQEVIIAIRDRLLEPGNLPRLVSRAPQLYQDLAGGIETNLSLDDAISLGILATQISLDQIQRGVIDYTMVTIGNSPDGLYIFKPIPDKIRELRDMIFTTGGPLSPLAQGADAAALMTAEGARVMVLNGTGTEGLAGQTGEYFKTLGMNVTSTGNADQVYQASIIIDKSGKPYTMRYLQQLFGISSSSQVRIQYDPNADADVFVIIGQDWAYNNPMP